MAYKDTIESLRDLTDAEMAHRLSDFKIQKANLAKQIGDLLTQKRQIVDYISFINNYYAKN